MEHGACGGKLRSHAAKAVRHGAIHAAPTGTELTVMQIGVHKKCPLPPVLTIIISFYPRKIKLIYIKLFILRKMCGKMECNLKNSEKKGFIYEKRTIPPLLPLEQGGRTGTP
jgi:hypothetical protein